MSSIPTQTGQGWWPSYAMPYITPPLSASVAIIPVFYGFIAKSAQQASRPLPKMTCREIFKEGLKASPTIGIIVGTQLVVQQLAEKIFNGSNPSHSFRSMLASSILVGTISAPALAIFNGQTMGCSVRESLKKLSFKQAIAIVSRETSFLFSLRISDPLSARMKQTQSNAAIECSSAFISGAIGSIIGHPADTALTLWQQGRKIANIRELMQGSPIKALTVGGFSVFYKLTKDSLESLSS